MRPLPVLIPLDEQPDVYQEQQDSFLTLFQQELDGHDSLLSELLGEQNTLGSNVAGIGDSIDNISSSLDVLFSTFDTLSAVLDTIDLSTDILDAFGLDQQLDSSLNSWAPDVNLAAAPFLAQLVDVLTAFFTLIVNFILELFVAIVHLLIEFLIELIQALLLF